VPSLFVPIDGAKFTTSPTGSPQMTPSRLARVAPHVKAEVVPGAGHDLTIVHPDLVTRRVLGFLGEQDGARRT
jgi:pimeloyl-ACP methyl ester carboxylesterase